jgi:arsenate reductase (thioredoxin)
MPSHFNVLFLCTGNSAARSWRQGQTVEADMKKLKEAIKDGSCTVSEWKPLSGLNSQSPSGRSMTRVRTFIFACVHNAGRSQMSAAFFNQMADPAVARGISAGTHPEEHVHPVVVDAMREVGIDLSSAKPQKLTAELAQGAEMLITMGCGDECPYVPGIIRDDWPVSDPKGQAIESVRRTRDEIKQRVAALIESAQVLSAPTNR